MNEVVQNLPNMFYHSKINSAISSLEMYKLNSYKVVTHAKLNLPLPYQARDIVFTSTTYFLEDGTTLMLHETSDLIPPIKNIIRCTVYLSGTRYKPLSATSTEVTSIIHTDPNGSIPSWISNNLYYGLVIAFMGIKRTFESNFHPADFYVEMKEFNDN